MKKEFRYLLLFLTLIFIFLFSFYYKILFAPNSFLFNCQGDAAKNYYTYAYYIKNNIGHIEFEGMNYPFSENIMYTDCHPLQANLLKFINQFFPEVSNYSIGIINSFMILSIAITGLFLYLIFIKLGVSSLLSVLGALAITILSPQLFRLTGHLALSYSFFIPITIYLLLLFEEKIRLHNTFILAFFLLVFFFTHAYLGMIASSLVFVYSCVGITNNFLYHREKSQFLKYQYTLVASIIPVAFFFFFVKLIDSHTGRTSNPWGIFEQHATLSTVFLPVSGGGLNVLKDIFFHGVKQTWEGWSYIGIVAIATFVICLHQIFRKKNSFSKFPKRHFINNIFITSIIILCLATLLPFRSILFVLVDNFDMIKQFRAIGRFAWVFFFVINIIAIFITNKWIIHLKNNNKNVIANTFIFIVPSIIALEGISYHISISQEITQSPNLFSLNQTSQYFQEDCNNINSKDYQGIISLPFFYIGSENFGKNGSEEIYKLSFLFSYHLGLPMVNSYLTRTSIHESKKIMQILSSGFIEKDIKRDLKSDKPFLVIYSHEELNEAEKSLLRRSKILEKRKMYSLYEINIDSIFQNTAKDEFLNFISKKNILYEKKGFLVSDTSLYFSYTDFKQHRGLSYNIDNTCFRGLQRDYNTIFSVKGSELDDSTKYIARFWIHNNGDNYGQDCLNSMIFFDKHKDGKNEWIFPVSNAINSHEINGNWSLVEVILTDISKEYDYKLVIKGSDRSTLFYYIDSLLFYDEKLEIYKIFDHPINPTLFYNNHEIPIHNTSN